MGRAHGACESQARREEESMLVASLTTRNEAWGRNPHVPCGFAAALGRLRRCRTHIAVVAGSAARRRERDPCHYSDTLLGAIPSRRGGPPGRASYSLARDSQRSEER